MSCERTAWYYERANIELIRKVILTLDATVIRRDLVLTIFRNQFSSYKSINCYFRILIFILVDRDVCWEHLVIICFCYGLVLLRIFWNKNRKNLESRDVLIYL